MSGIQLASEWPPSFEEIEILPGIKGHVEASEIRTDGASAPPNECDSTRFRELAQLETTDYDRIRKAEAKRLGIRVTTLDAEIEKFRAKDSSNRLQGSEVNLVNVVPWPEPVAGATVLSEVSRIFSDYVALPTGAADVLALWCAHVYAFCAFLCSPRLNVQSPEKGCGKTTLLDVIAEFVPRPLRTENLTTAVLFRLVQAHAPTILADECDAWFKNNEELRGLLNAGHRRGAAVFRCEGDNNEVRTFAAYAPAALSGIGSLPGTLRDRSIIIRLARAKSGEIRRRFDPRDTEEENKLRRKVARWTADNFQRLQAMDPVLPVGVFNRLADNWRPLFAIAEVAGDDWPARAVAAFVSLTEKVDIDDEGIGIMLLTDIREIFRRTNSDPIPTAELVEELVKMEDRPWPEFNHGKPITKVKVSRLLKRFGIVSATKRDGEITFKGYDRSGFNDAFERYILSTNS